MTNLIGKASFAEESIAAIIYCGIAALLTYVALDSIPFDTLFG